jgi:hypothetical protein
MVPVSLVLLMATPVLDYFVKDMGTIRLVSHLALNLVILVVALGFAGRALRADRPERVRFPERPVAVPPKEEEAAA